jgi:hypothetical protein
VSIIWPQTKIAREIRRTVLRRARHRVLDDVTKTLSDWSVADIVAGEYHERFLVELIQNARDAFLEQANDATDGIAPKDRTDGILRVRLTDEPALTVANQGSPLPANVLLQSIGRFGLGTRTEGQSIGHKGIGFKSVLELSLTPEIYSCRHGEDYDLAVRFDPEQAADLVREHSPRWDELVREAPGGADPAAPSHIPTLLFPLWVNDAATRLGDSVSVDGVRFDTLIRLPHDARFDDDLRLDRRTFIDKVQKAMRGITDQMVLLLGSFGRIIIEDEHAGTVEVISRREVQRREVGRGILRSEVVIDRDGREHSRWLLFSRSLPGFSGFEGDLAVAARIERGEADRAVLVGPVVRPGDAGDAFHLFFPTQIPTHLPLLLHAYFRVDAKRLGFAGPEDQRNQTLLAGLGELGIEVLDHVLNDSSVDVDASGLPALLARADGTPEGLVGEFRDGLLRGLDALAWVPVQAPAADGPSRVTPAMIVVEPEEALLTELPRALPPDHVYRRAGLCYPAASISSAGLRFVMKRTEIAREGGTAGLTRELLTILLRQGEDAIWGDDPSAVDDGFRQLLAVLAVLKARKSGPAGVLDDPAVAPSLAFIPVLRAAPAMRQLRSPVVGSGVQRTTPWILARPDGASGGQAAPPTALGIDFLPDGLLPDETSIRAAAYLGIREYRVDAILDALAPEVLESSAAAEITAFIWEFLVRDTTSPFSVPKAAQLLPSFTPGRWFWSQPDVRDDAHRQEMGRNRALSSLPLPAADGSPTPRPAGELVLGEAWATWLESRGWTDSAERAEAYRDLEAAAPGPWAVLAPPEVIQAYLGPAPAPLGTDGDDGSSAPDPDRLLLAFLLRIGVWEVPPILSINDLSSRTDDELDPWAHREGRAEHAQWLADLGSDFARRGHRRVHVGEDFALRWPLGQGPALLASLARGKRLYEQCLRQHAYCTGCQAPGTHKNKAWDSDTDPMRVSFLRWQLQETPWIPVTRYDDPDAEPVRSLDAWRDDASFDPAHMAQSSARFLRIATREVPAGLLDLLGIDDVDGATLERASAALRWLHDSQAALLGREARPTSDLGRAYLSLHRRFYKRLETLGEDAARDATAATGVLATRGASLVFVDRHEARHDRGTFALYRRQFTDAIPFLAVKGDEPRVADALGVRPFVVDAKRLGDDDGEDVTDALQEFLHDRVHLFMAILSFYAVGGNTIEVDGRAFRARALRLSALRIRRVADLRLTIRVAGTSESRTIGALSNDEIHVDGPLSPTPVVYEDFHGADWVRRFRRAFAPYLATVVENDSYATVLRLLLEAETDAEAWDLIRELGITDYQVDEVRRAIATGDELLRGEEERWWRALLPQFGSDLEVRPQDEQWRSRLRATLGRAGMSDDPAVLELLLDSGLAEGNRRDISERGILAALEAARVDLATFHAALVALGDRGLDVRAAERRLRAWRSAHEREAVAVLAFQHDLEAMDRPKGWVIPPSETWKVATTPAVFLAPVVHDLEAVALLADPEALAGPSASAALAALVGSTPEGLFRWWVEQGGDGVEITAAQAAGWRHLLRPVLTAAMTGSRQSRFEIRARATAVDVAFGGTQTPMAVSAAIPGLLPGLDTLAVRLQDLVRGHVGLGLPSPAVIADVAITAGLDAVDLEFVRAVLAARTPEVADHVRRDVQVLTELKLRPVEVGLKTPPDGKGTAAEGSARVKVKKIKRGSADTGAIGRAGERWARAAIMRDLLSLSSEERAAAVDEIERVIRLHFEDDAVELLLQAAADYRRADDEDAAIDALAALVHVSAVSDAFGFDLIGYLPDESRSRRVLLLEVKATGDRKFIVSRHEWHVAGLPGIRDIYAFMTVGRNAAGQPVSMEVVINPAAMSEAGRLRMREEDWGVRYWPEHATVPAAEAEVWGD